MVREFHWCGDGIVSKRRVTIRDVARRADVSTATVSRVLNRTAKASEKARKAVECAARELNYFPSALARGLATNRIQQIALILPDIANPSYSAIVKGIESAANARCYNVLLANSEGTPEKELKCFAMLRNKVADGLIYITNNAEDPRIRTALQELSENGYPFVLVDEPVIGVQADLVVADNFHGACAAVEHLLNLGHKRIGHITGSRSTESAKSRLAGYIHCLKSRNVEVEEAWIKEGDYRHTSGYELTKALLSLEHRPTALFVANDMMAVGALSAADELGLDVPGDLSVVGFDDNDIASLVRPKLTTVAQPLEEMGSIAARLLLDRIELGHAGAAQTIVVSTSLKIRESSAPFSG